MTATARRGFTLIEALAVIAVTAVLTGLLVPAVQKVRAAAARVSCQSHLRQVGLAAQGYHATFDAFPPGVTPWRPGQAFGRLNWLARLLPYVEQDALWAVTADAYRVEPDRVLGGVHRGFVTPIKLFACPADERFRPHLTVGGIFVANTSFLGVSGIDYTRADGVYYSGSATRLPHITDGASNTLAAGERPPSPDYAYGWWYASALWIPSGGQAVLGVREIRLPGDPLSEGCPTGPYAFRPGSLTEQCDALHFWSLHPGGANFAFCDGSVRFLPHSADGILPALATRAGGETVSLD